MMLGDCAIPVGPIFLLLGFALIFGLLAVLIRLFAPRHEAAYRQKAFLSPAKALMTKAQALGQAWMKGVASEVARMILRERPS